MQIDNRAVINEKKEADKGIDGVAYTRKSKDEISPVLISVKSGKSIGVSEVRDLFGVVESEGAVCGIYITRNPPTSAMIEFTKQQGQFKPEMFQPFDKLQIVTIQQIPDGERMNLPLMEEVTKKAPLSPKKASTLSAAKPVPTIGTATNPLMIGSRTFGRSSASGLSRNYSGLSF